MVSGFPGSGLRQYAGDLFRAKGVLGFRGSGVQGREES